MLFEKQDFYVKCRISKKFVVFKSNFELMKRFEDDWSYASRVF